MSAVVDIREDATPADDDLDIVVRRWSSIPTLAGWRNLGTRAKIARVCGAAVLFTLAMLGPHPLKSYGPTFALDLGLIYALVVIAVSVLGWIGEISLAVVAQMGFGLLVVNYLQRHHWPFGLVLLAVVASSIPFSIILGLFALRLRGINFVIATLAFGYLVQRSALAEYMGAGASEKGSVSRPSFLRTDDRLYYWILASLVVVAVICYLIQRSRLGKAITAMRDSETAFWTLGHSTAAYKLFAVCLSGAIATLAGAYFALLQLQVPAIYYQPGLAIVFFGFALAGGFGSIGGAIAAGVFFGALPKYLEAYTNGGFTKYDFFFYGFFSLLIFMKIKGGLGGLGQRLWGRIEGRAA
jgi:branched-chain amino acid transport system permease protein